MNHNYYLRGGGQLKANILAKKTCQYLYASVIRWPSAKDKYLSFRCQLHYTLLLSPLCLPGRLKGPLVFASADCSVCQTNCHPYTLN